MLVVYWLQKSRLESHLVDSLVNSLLRSLLPSEISRKTEVLLKNIALLLGLLSAIAIIFDWYPLTMFLSFPFCLIWIYCAWLRTEPQLKWVNLIFLVIYFFGIARYFFQIVVQKRTGTTCKVTGLLKKVKYEGCSVEQKLMRNLQSFGNQCHGVVSEQKRDE